MPIQQTIINIVDTSTDLNLLAVRSLNTEYKLCGVQQNFKTVLRYFLNAIL